MRALVLAICLLGCKKHQDQEPAPEPPAEPSRGHSFTPFKEAGVGGDEASGSSAAAAEDAGADARLWGGDSSPAYRDQQGHVHGPGGPVYMGHGVPCDASRDHCMRDGVWFGASDLRQGAMYRAVPGFELEGKWYDWRGNDLESGKLFKTELATLDTLQAGAPIIFMSPENSGLEWPESQYDALTSSRWEATYVESVNRAAKTFRVKGWPDDLSIDVARVITEQSHH